MESITRMTSVCLALVLMHVPLVADAQRTGVVADSHAAPTLSPKARGELARQFVSKWGAHVERVYDVGVGVWAERMVPSFVSADATNFRNALKRSTFEGAAAELNGAGHRLSDREAMARLEKASLGVPGNASAKALDSGTFDLVYTPMRPCRIVDTRVTAAGAIPANATRSFLAMSTDFAHQGGSTGDCGFGSATQVGAVALNITAVVPATAGFATVYPFNTSRPLTSSVNYAAGAIVNNAIITSIPNPLLSSDFTVYTFAEAHYVIDVVGYFSAPQATALQCVNTTRTQLVDAGANFNMILPACPTGFTLTGAGCGTAVFNQASWTYSGMAGDAAQCIGTNITSGQIGVQGYARCCRVPGR